MVHANTQSLAVRHLAPGVVLRERWYDPDAGLGRHHHAHATLILVLEGLLRERCDGRSVARRPGELHLLPAGLSHTTSVAGSGARVFLVGLYPEWLDVCDERRIAVLHSLVAPRGSRSAVLGRGMYEEFRGSDVASGLALEGMLLEVLGTLLRLRSSVRRAAVPPWLGNVRDRLADEFATPPTATELASEAGVSVGHLFRAFRTSFGTTPGDYVREARVAYAKQALRESTEPISQIAVAAGFSDQAHLTRVFHELVGITPAAYRRLHQAG